MKVSLATEDRTKATSPFRSAQSESSEPFTLPVDPWRLLAVLQRHSLWLVLAALVVGGGVFFVLPRQLKYIATIHLVRQEPSSLVSAERATRPLRGQVFSSAPILGFLRSSNLLQRIRDKMQLSLAPEKMAEAVQVLPLESTDIISVRITDPASAERTAQLANSVAEEAAAFSRQLQASEARELSMSLQEALAAVDSDAATVNQELLRFLQEAGLFDYETEKQTLLQQRQQLEQDYGNLLVEFESADPKIKNLQEEVLLQKQAEIDNLLLRLTEDHPLAQRRLAELAALKTKWIEQGEAAQLEADVRGPAAATLVTQIVNLRLQKMTLARQMEEVAARRDQVSKKLALLSEKDQQHYQIQQRRLSLEKSRAQLADRQREVDLSTKNPSGSFRPVAVLSPDDVSVASGLAHSLVLSAAVACLFFFAGAALLLIVEVRDDRIKTAGDLWRVTGLPVLATLGDLNDMDPKQQMSSALRGWSLIFGRTCQAAGDTFICGFVSSRPGEGCTTWIKRLAEAARQRGYRVVAFSTNPTSSPVPGPITTDAIAANPIPALRNGADWLREGLLQLEKSPTQFVEFSPPCDWKWNCEQVEQWKAALREYSGRARTVVLVELPPAQLPESVLLADTVPRAIWLASSGLPRRSESREQLETLLSARCNLVGAVLNREPGGILRNGQSR